MSALEKPREFTADADVALGLAVVNAVGTVSDTPVEDLPLLHDAIDPEALDALFSGRRTRGRTEFRYAGHLVTVHADRTIEVSRGG